MELEPLSVSSPDESMAMVHRGRKASKERTTSFNSTLNLAQRRVEQTPEAQVREVPSVPQEFEFVNGTYPFVNKDPEVRKLIRAHVVRDASRKKRHFKELNRRPKRESVQSPQDAKEPSENEDSGSNVEGTIAGDNTSISRYSSISVSQGLDPNPELSPVIYHIKRMVTAMWPLEDYTRFNPISPAAWFDWALSDEALFHALLSTTSKYAGLILGKSESKHGIVHEGKSMSLVKQRLSILGSIGPGSDGTEISEGTIGAVSFLALGEALRGNTLGWQAHMSGSRQMAELKGGILKLSLKLRLKLHRADLTGSVDFLETPFFAENNQLPQYSSSISATQFTSAGTKNLLKFLATLPMAPILLNTLMKLSIFSHQISLILSNPITANISSQTTLIEEIYGLRYALLKLSALGSVNTPLSSPEELLNEVLCIGALLYLQATLQEFPFSANGSRKLVTRMRNSVMVVRIRNQREGELMVWLLFVTGLEARHKEDRMWVVDQLAKLVGRLGLEWEGVRGALEGLWWVGQIHEKRCKGLWDEVVLSTSLDEGMKGG